MALLTLAVAANVTLSSCSSEVTLQVRTEQGIVEGFDQEGVKTFLGIPFAAAPIGELRWRAPQTAPKWEGVHDAKAFGDDPMQPDIFGDMNFRGPRKSEDCLYLNIWTCASRTSDKLPVLIYFNGGGLMAGSGSEPRYDGAAIAREGVIGVTANYREGIFGFFAHPELTAEEGGSGSYGHLDQVAAIKWVRDNISAFGGDPERITIAGESAGSFSVALLMASPLSKDLIAGAILSSGAEMMPYNAIPLDVAEADGKARLEEKAVMSISAARDIPADELQNMFPPVGMSRLILDGVFMNEPADAIFARSEQAAVPMLAGWNSLEGTPLQSLMGMEPNLDNYRKVMSGLFGDMTDEIFEAYGLKTDNDLFGQKGQNLAGDMFTGLCTWKACDYQSRIQPVYRYKYNHPRPKPSAKMGDMVGALAGGVREKTEAEKKAPAPKFPMPKGAVHSADIEYAMGNLATNVYYDWQEEDYAISKLFLSYYANFCKNGNPNGKGLPQWSPLDPANGKAPVMQIDVESGELDDPALENAYRTLEKFYTKNQ